MTTPPAGSPDPLPKTRILWIILLLLLAATPAFLLGDHRRSPQKGVPAGLLQEAAGPASPIDPATLFTLGMVLDELILLMGVWLLARSLFSDSRTWFFVSVAVLGSSLWIGHPASNFRSFHALPLLIHLARRFRASGSPASLLAGLTLAGLQALGKPSFQALLTPLAALLLLAVFRRFLDPPPSAPKPPWNPRILGWAAAAGGLSWIPVAATILSGPAGAMPPAPSSFGLDALGLSGLDNPGCFLDLFVGLAPIPDYTLYGGFLTLGFALYALACAGARSSLRIFAEALAVLLLLGLIAAVSLRLAPAPPALRPAAVGAPLWRLLLGFLAGSGFEHWLHRRSAPRASIPWIGGALLALGAALLHQSAGIPSTLDLPGSAAACFAPRSPAAISPIFNDRTTVREFLDTSAFWALAAGGLFLLAGSRNRSLPLAVALILLLHPLDVFGWKLRVSGALTESRFWRPPAPLEIRLTLPGDEAVERAASTGILRILSVLWIAGMAATAGSLAWRPCDREPAAGGSGAG